MNLAQHRYGRLPWREVVTPAEAMARSGFVLGSAADYYLQHTRDSVFAWDRQTSASLRRGDGNWVQESDRMVIDGLADTLALVAENGARTMYDGELAHDIAADMDRRGGLLTRDDMSAYRPVVREALACGSGGWALRTNPPPAFGGAVLTAMLSLLGDRPRGDWTVEDVTHVVAVFRRVLGYRRDRLDVAADRDMAVRALLDEVGIAQPGSASTAHISVVDSAGATCAITASSGYGSGATVPGTGLWLNNCLGEHELNRGPTPLPGERLPSNMAPTVGRSDDGGVLAIGSPGADRITTALTQVLASLTSGRSGLQQAIDRPRLHLHYLDEAPDAVRIEAEEDMPLPETDLTVRRHHRLSMYFGGVAAAHRSASGEIIAADDPRRAGAVRGQSGLTSYGGRVTQHNLDLLDRFYAAFARHDGDTMAACYTADATFSDPVFTGLSGKEPGAMWQMLTRRSTDLSIELVDRAAAGDKGSAHWVARYPFGKAGRRVVNEVRSTFRFQDGLIAEQRDDFDLYRWTRQALGPVGVALGWTPVVQGGVRRRARAGLDEFLAQQG